MNSVDNVVADDKRREREIGGAGRWNAQFVLVWSTVIGAFPRESPSLVFIPPHHADRKVLFLFKKCICWSR